MAKKKATNPSWCRGRRGGHISDLPRYNKPWPNAFPRPICICPLLTNSRNLITIRNKILFDLICFVFLVLYLFVYFIVVWLTYKKAIHIEWAHVMSTEIRIHLQNRPYRLCHKLLHQLQKFPLPSLFLENPRWLSETPPDTTFFPKGKQSTL